MKLTTIGTGSRGNCYLLTSQTGETLIIEAGMPYSEVAKTIGAAASGIVGCIISHEHRDHCAYTLDYIKQGIDCYMNQSTFESLTRHKAISIIDGEIINSGQIFKVGNFTIMALEVEHDAPCLMFLVQHSELGKLVYLTDTQYSKWRYNNVDVFMVEANYDRSIVEQRIEEASKTEDTREELTLRMRLKRLSQTHMEINTTIDFLQANREHNPMCKVILIHTSCENASPADFKLRAQRATGRQVYIAEKGQEIEL